MHSPPASNNSNSESAGGTIAEVALNLPLRRTFDYRLDDGDAGVIQPGSRVIVPFGNRLKAGVAVALKAHSGVPPGRLKTVDRSTDPEPLFSGEMLGFTRWMSEYYLCGWGEVLDAALPSGLGVRFRVQYRWREAPPPEALAGLSEKARALVEGDPGLSDGWSAGQWARHAEGTGDARWLARQARPGGLIAVEYEYAGARTAARTERWVRPLEPPPGEPTPGTRRRAGKETRAETVLRVLREEGAVPVSRLSALMKDPGAVVRKLATAGWLAMEERTAAAAEPPLPPPEDFLTLNGEQQAAYEAIAGALGGEEYRAFLLDGVTGSGKTEIYLHAVRTALAQGRGCLLLVPEIALTEAIVGRFKSRFGRQVAVLHSALGEYERFETWNRVRAGTARIVIGARSAVFAPVAALGLVIVDEEHDTSYKQDDAPRYHGRDAALMRAYQAGAVAVLGSATPSLEAERNVALEKLTRLRLTRRVEERPLPPVHLLDLRTTPRQPGCAIFTKPLVTALRETLLRKEQAILFLNRRGYGSLARCTACEETLLCAHCTITLTYHSTGRHLLCHRCDYRQPLPDRCPACGQGALEVVGLGTERIEQEAALIFPRARVLRMDSDTLRRRGELERLMAAIRERRYDIIIGTQVLSKGHDFPHITLVAAVLADISLNLPDFRAPERTFQLLTQMAGRAGRGEKPGLVLIQTYNPDHYALTHVTRHDTRAFAETELEMRAAHQSPPFASQALVWVSAPRPERAEALAGEVGALLRQAADGKVRVLGPTEAPIRKLSGRYRWMILLKAPSAAPIRRVLEAVLDDGALKKGSRERVIVDVDPYNLM